MVIRGWADKIITKSVKTFESYADLRLWDMGEIEFPLLSYA